MKQVVENYHADAIKFFRNYKKLAERAISFQLFRRKPNTCECPNVLF